MEPVCLQQSEMLSYNALIYYNLAKLSFDNNEGNVVYGNTPFPRHVYSELN